MNINQMIEHLQKLKDEGRGEYAVVVLSQEEGPFEVSADAHMSLQESNDYLPDWKEVHEATKNLPIKGRHIHMDALMRRGPTLTINV